MPFLVHLLFFLSGAAALVYEVAWARSLGLVFGASHLAVTTVLAVFMGGLALGSRLLGRSADRSRRTLRLYGALEIGIGASALAFLGMTRLQGPVYVHFARLAEDNLVYLSVLRVAFATAAMIVPTLLMGGTLPVLSRFVGDRTARLGRNLSLLYGVNTLGAMTGALSCGFLLLPRLGVDATVVLAAAINCAVGLTALLLPERLFGEAESAKETARPEEAAPPELTRLVLIGIGVGGFCALGYEVLWTRMLTLVVGTSVYSFTIILVAFLGGIGIGGQSCALLLRRLGRTGRAVRAFGLTEIATGVSALAVTILMRDLPDQAPLLQKAFGLLSGTEFGTRQWASFSLAFAYVFVPAFLGGIAFPLAAAIHAAGRPAIGRSVGEVLSVNTVGAILGSAASGFVLIQVFGVERSLQMLAVLNVGTGLVVLAAPHGGRLKWATVAAAAALLAMLGIGSSWSRTWDLKSFALFINSARYPVSTPFQKKDARDDTNVLYYFEGANEIISVVHRPGAWQSFIVNGRPEASTAPMDMQCQRTLGHLPMLLHPRPGKVFVLGTGTGMTLGATALHPEVESIVLAEIEPGALDAARTFGEYNHRVLDDPRLRIVHNDGRNYLAVTREKFDVVTADPIHPWSGGAAYLYTDEYFSTVAQHLLPGGVASQWLPLYELTVRDVQTVVRTFARNFPYVMVWLTSYDAELVGSNQPLSLDEDELARRISRPSIARDLSAVQMGSAEDFLSYFALGDAGARAFGEGGVINTDDNLWLEFSAPESMGVGEAIGGNVMALARMRESIIPYLVAAPGPARQQQLERWRRIEAVAHDYDLAHALHEWGATRDPRFGPLRDRLRRDLPGYAPFRFLERQLAFEQLLEPRLLRQETFLVRSATGPRSLAVSAVVAPVSEERRALIFVDNDKRDIFGQRYFEGPADAAVIEGFARDVLGTLSQQYANSLSEARSRGEELPGEASIAERFRQAVAARIAVR